MNLYEQYLPDESRYELTDLACELLAYFYADREISEMPLEHPGIWRAYRMHRSARIIKLLIETSTLYRIAKWNMQKHEKEKEEQKDPVGVLTLEDGVEHTLSLHDACNKIIHAKNIYLRVKNSETKKPTEPTYIEKVFGTEGTTQGGKNWKALINITKFCDGLLRVEDSKDFEGEDANQTGDDNSE